jgi:hypothetical protein
LVGNVKGTAWFVGTGMRNDNINVGLKVIWRNVTQ